MILTRLGFAFLLIFLTIAGFSGCRRAGTWLVKENIPRHADAMVLLMGSFPERVLQAADLYLANKAARLIIVEESMGEYAQLTDRGVQLVSSTSQARDAAAVLGIPYEKISVIPGDARSTIDEAKAVRSFISCNDIDTLLLVSSPAHMRRASIIFKAAFKESGKKVYIGCSPSTYSSFNPQKWWQNREDAQMVLSEYVKTVIFVLLEKRTLKQ